MVGSQRPLWALGLLFLCSHLVVAQPAIDVAAIRENRGPFDDYSKGIRLLPGQLQVTNLTLEALVAAAYGLRSPLVRDRLIVGWPTAGIKDKRFDVMATLTTASAASREDRRRIVLELLTTRFGFKAHLERRQLDGYALLRVKPNALGPGLKRVDFNCAEVSISEAPKDADGRSLCRQASERRPPPGGFRIQGPEQFAQLEIFHHGSGDIKHLIQQLETMSNGQRLISDATGLQGYFVWDLKYATRQLPTAIREDLGLELVARKVPVDVVVIDEVRMPTPN